MRDFAKLRAITFYLEECALRNTYRPGGTRFLEDLAEIEDMLSDG